MCKINLCALILKEHFGEVVEKVGLYLAKKGLTPLGILVKETGITSEKVQ